MREDTTTPEAAELFETAIAAGRNRDYATAVDVLNRLIATTDQFPQAFLYLGRSYHALGEFEKAVRSLDSYVRLRPDSAVGYFFLGRSFLALGMYQTAAKKLREAVSRNPHFPHAYGLLGFAYLRAKRPERSLEFFRKALELDPASKSLLAGYLNATMLTAVRLFHRGNLTDSGLLFNEVLRLRGHDMTAHVYLASIYKDLGKDNAALLHLEAASGMSPQDPLLHLQKSWILLQQGDKKQALEELRVGMYYLKSEAKIGGTPEEILRFIAVQLFSEGRYKEAIFHATKLLRLVYDDPQLHALVAEAYRNLGDNAKARNHYTRALEKNKESVEFRYGMIASLWSLGELHDLLAQTAAILRKNPQDEFAGYFQCLALARTEGALPQQLIGALQQQIRLRGPDAQLMSALGTAYLKSGLPDLAESWFRRTLKVAPHDRESLEAIVRICAAQDKKHDLKDAYRTYLGAFPDDRASRKSLVRVLLELEAFADASEEVLKLLPAEPHNMRLKSVLALCYRQCGKFSEALVVLKDLLRHDPASEDTMKAVIYCLDKLGARKAAQQLISAFAGQHGERLSLVLMLGVLQYQEGSLEECAQSFRKAIGIAPQDWRAYRNLATVYRKMGNTVLAETFQRHAEERRKTNVE